MFLERVGSAAISLLLILVEVPFLSLEIKAPFLAAPVTITSVNAAFASVRAIFIFEASPN